MGNEKRSSDLPRAFGLTDLFERLAFAGVSGTAEPFYGRTLADTRGNSTREVTLAMRSATPLVAEIRRQGTRLAWRGILAHYCKASRRASRCAVKDISRRGIKISGVWFDRVVKDAKIERFRWHELRQYVRASALAKNAKLEHIAEAPVH
jgi:hypothetical protein